jgi:hypothetical protein
MVQGEKIWKRGKNTIFLSPIHFFTSFSITSRKKSGPAGKKLFLLKLISKKLSRKEGKVNTIQRGQREKHRHRAITLTQRERIF